MTTDALPPERFALYQMDIANQQAAFMRDVAAGLTAAQKSLPPKYFYDERGSQLYEQICDLSEYYPYRAEREILATYAPDIYAALQALPLVELGPGNASKTHYLLTEYARAGQPFLYCPVDIALTALHTAAQALLATFSQIAIRALHADFASHPEVLRGLQLRRKAVAFFGSSLGNFTPEDSVQLLRGVAASMGPEDRFLLGIDLKKSPALLVPAYDDAQGVTAAFNLNLLHRMNRELGANFDPTTFSHLALYNAAQGRIEMHLQSRAAQEVTIAAIGKTIAFRAGETIHTENSYKYSVEEVQALGAQAHLQLERTWRDRQGYFLLALFRPV
jgi:L-histidine Nalpha-methyltransferase